MKKNFLLSLVLVFFVLSCNSMQFIYNDKINLSNPLYNNTSLKITGKETSTTNINAIKYFGSNSDSEYILEISIAENKKKRAVQTNQAVSKEDYTLKFNYNIIKKDSYCSVYTKEISSNFSYVPKSSGYNFGSDQSLIKLYELAEQKNMQEFISLIIDINLKKCLNES